MLKNAGNDIHLLVVRVREDLEKRTVVKTSKENLTVSDDADEIDKAIDEALVQEEVNEVNTEPELDKPQVGYDFIE